MGLENLSLFVPAPLTPPCLPAPPLYLLQKLVAGLNASTLNTGTEVVIAPPAPYLDSIGASLRGDFSLAAQVSTPSAPAD